MEKSNHIPAGPDAKPEAQTQPMRASFGERAFNWITYGVWNHGANLVLSTLVALGFTGSKMHRSTVNWLKNRGMQESTAELITGITVLSSGGHVTALGVKPLEDRKERIVHDLNARYAPEETDKPIVDSRKQTWASVIGARVFTLGLAVVSFSGLKGLLGNNDHGVPRIDAFQERVGKWFANTVKPVADVTDTTRYKLGKILALEVIIVSVMSTLFYFSSKLLSKKPPELLPAKVKPQVAPNNAVPEAEGEQPKTNFAERVREQEAAESLGALRA